LAASFSRKLERLVLTFDLELDAELAAVAEDGGWMEGRRAGPKFW